MKSRLFLFLMLILFPLYGCSKQDNCLTASTAKELKIQQLNQAGLFLYLRSAGFNEKEHFFELYKTSVQFDNCGATASEPAFQMHVNDSKGFPIRLDIFSNKMEIVYTENAQDKIGLELIKIKFHDN